MTPQQIMNGLEEKNRQLTSKNDELIDLVTQFAEDKRNYAVALAQKITELKIKGEPATTVETIAKGDKIVADLRYKKDVSDGVMKACQQRIRTIVTQIDSYRSVLTWMREELNQR